MYKFRPILKSLIWGGEKIAPYKGIDTDMKAIGESWEISGVKENESIVAGGAADGIIVSKTITPIMKEDSFAILCKIEIIEDIAAVSEFEVDIVD